MSKYNIHETIFRNAGALEKALADVCQARGIEFETGAGNSLHLYGWHGDRRPETANYVIRRRYVSMASNDVGFALQPDGTYQAIVSQFDMGSEDYGIGLVHAITERYNYHALTEMAWAQGYTLAEEENANGETVLLFNRAY